MIRGDIMRTFLASVLLNSCADNDLNAEPLGTCEAALRQLTPTPGTTRQLCWAPTWNNDTMVPYRTEDAYARQQSTGEWIVGPVEIYQLEQRVVLALTAQGCEVVPCHVFQDQ